MSAGVRNKLMLALYRQISLAIPSADTTSAVFQLASVAGYKVLY